MHGSQKKCQLYLTLFNPGRWGFVLLATELVRWFFFFSHVLLCSSLVYSCLSSFFQMKDFFFIFVKYVSVYKSWNTFCIIKLQYTSTWISIWLKLVSCLHHYFNKHVCLSIHRWKGHESGHIDQYGCEGNHKLSFEERINSLTEDRGYLQQ